MKAEKWTDKLGVKDAQTGNSIAFIGKLVFAIVFLLFLPGALDKLGMSNVSAPISGLTTQFLNYIPNIIAAAILLYFGIFLGKLLSGIVGVLIAKTGIDEKLGEKTERKAVLSDIIAKLVNALIVIVAMVAALQVLGIEAISKPAMDVVNQVLGILPSVFAAIIIMVIGAFLADLIAKLLESLLAGAGFDAFASKLTPERKDKIAASRAVSVAVKVIITIIFAVEAVNVLKLDVLSNIGAAVLTYLPLAISALIILAIAWFGGAWTEKLIASKNDKRVLTGKLAKYAIVVLGVFMALSQLKIASNIVNAMFIIALASVGVSAAIAFGVGGCSFAKHTLEKIDDGHKNTVD